MASEPALHLCLACGSCWCVASPDYCPLCHSVEVTTVQSPPAVIARPAPQPRPLLRLVGFSPIGTGDPTAP